MEPVLGEDDPDVRQRGLGEDAGDVLGSKRFLEPVEVVELHDLRRQRRVNGRPDIPGARPHDAVLGRRERLVDRPVVAPVEDEHLPAAGHLTGEPQCEAVRVGRGQRELPEREPEAPRQLLADPGRVLGRKHRRRAARRLGSERLDDRLRRVPGHRARVAEAEVDVLVAVDVDDPRALRLLDEHRESARPASHPAHRDAEQERRAGALAQLERTRMALAEGLELVLEPRGQPIAVDRDHPPPRSLHRHRSVQLRHHVLDLRVVLERVHRQILAVARLLVAAVRHLGDERDVVVDPDRPELELARRVQRPADVARPDGSREAVVDVVRPRERLRRRRRSAAR